MAYKSDISIIIPTYNRPDMLQRCLESVRCQTVAPYAVIVMDQSEDNGSELVCLNYSVDYHRCQYKNKSMAINEAMSFVKSSWIAIIDDDTILSRDWNKVLMLKRQIYPEIEIVQGDIYSDNAANEDIHKNEQIVKKRIITPLFLIGCNFAFSIKLYNRVGPFNETLGPGTVYKGGEDIEWGYRVFSQRNTLLICPEMGLTHLPWRNQCEITNQMYNYGIAIAAVLKIIRKISALDFIYYYLKIHIWVNSNLFIKKLTGNGTINAYISYKKGIMESYKGE